MQPQSPSVVQHFLFKCLVNMKAEEQDVAVEIHWVEGQNKDMLNQLDLPEEHCLEWWPSHWGYNGI